MVFLGFLRWFWWSTARNHRKNQEKPPKTTTNHQNHRKNQDQPKKTPFSNYLSKSRIRGFSWFLRWFWWSRTRNHRKNQENHQNSIWRDGLKIVVFLVFLGFCAGFGGLSWFLVVFLGFYGGFGGQELETTAKTKKNHRKNQEKPRILDFER